MVPRTVPGPLHRNPTFIFFTSVYFEITVDCGLGGALKVGVSRLVGRHFCCGCSSFSCGRVEDYFTSHAWRGSLRSVLSGPLLFCGFLDKRQAFLCEGFLGRGVCWRSFRVFLGSNPSACFGVAFVVQCRGFLLMACVSKDFLVMFVVPSGNNGFPLSRSHFVF